MNTLCTSPISELLLCVFLAYSGAAFLYIYHSLVVMGVSFSVFGVKTSGQSNYQLLHSVNKVTNTGSRI